MGTQNGQSNEDGEPIVSLQIMEPSNRGSKKLSDQWGSSYFEPQREMSGEKTDSNANTGGSYRRSTDLAPEKKLTLFALRLAIIEKMASGVGALGFIWATVVLLGGFAVTLKNIDFWLVTTVLVIEGARIFSRSHELEWQHQATWSISGARRRSFRALKSSSRFMLRAIKVIFRPFTIIQRDSKRSQRLDYSNRSTGRSQNRNQEQKLRTQRTWQSHEIPLLPYAQRLFQSSNVSRLLYWFQLISAAACVALSLMRLIEQDFGEIREGDTDKNNRNPALILFYGLSLAEASLFLMEKVYWEWKVSYRKLLDEVNDECGFGGNGMVSIKRFFYDAYSKSINGSIFDGLKMDLADFASELLESDSHDEQLIGARILQKFSTNDQFADETLRKIGTSTTVMERLLEMLNWKHPEEEEIRRCAAETLSKLAGKKRNALRVAGISGAMESISSLLYSKRAFNCTPHEIGEKLVVADRENYEFSAFNLLGLLILKKLAHDHDNCWKIGNTRGLLPKIIEFTSSGHRLLRDDRVTESQIKAMKRSLQVVKLLASTTGTTGEALRREISDIVFTISNIREILQNGENYMNLQKLGIEILTSLAMDKDAREKIGCTGGIFKELFSIFCKPGLTEMQNAVRVEAGEALTMLALDSKHNCHQILRLEVVERLVEALDDSIPCVNSARMLRNLCAYSGDEYFFRLRAVTAAIPTVLNAIMLEDMKFADVSVGLATQIFKFSSPEELAKGFESSGIKENELAEKLVQILKIFEYPSIKVPRMRRNVIELAIFMMESNVRNIEIFRNFGMEKELNSVADTTSELERFNVFSGSVGLSQHHLTVQYLIDTALEKLAQVQNQ